MNDTGAIKIEKHYRRARGTSGAKLNIMETINCSVSFRGQDSKDTLHIMKEIHLKVFGGDWL